MIQPFLLFILSLSAVHPFHVSVCSIHHAPAEQTLQITQKIFADDLEEALNATGGSTTIDVIEPPDPAVLEAIITTYLSEHLRITVNGQDVKPVFLGYEREELALWCYLEVGNVTDVESVAVRSTILTNIFDDQTNIVHVEYQDVIKSMKLAKNFPKDQVVF